MVDLPGPAILSSRGSFQTMLSDTPSAVNRYHYNAGPECQTTTTLISPTTITITTRTLPSPPTSYPFVGSDGYSSADGSTHRQCYLPGDVLASWTRHNLTCITLGMLHGSLDQIHIHSQLIAASRTGHHPSMTCTNTPFDQPLVRL